MEELPCAWEKKSGYLAKAAVVREQDTAAAGSEEQEPIQVGIMSASALDERACKKAEKGYAEN